MILKDHLAGFRLKYITLEVPPFRVTASRFTAGPLQACGASFLLLSNISFQLLFRKKIIHTSAAFRRCLEIQKEISTDIFHIWTESFVIYSVYNEHTALRVSVLQFFLLHFN